MKCQACEKDIEGRKFCIYCGHEQEIAENNDIKDKESKSLKKNKRIYAFVLCGIVLSVVIGIAFIMSIESKSDTFINMIKEGNVAGAKSYYSETLLKDENELKRAEEKVKENLSVCIEAYNKGELSYKEAQDEIELYKGYFENVVPAARTTLNQLYSSKEAFSSAEEMYKAQDYIEAYRQYLKVIENDANYEVVKDKLEECYEMMLDALFVQADAYISENNYISAISFLKGNINLLREDDKNIIEAQIEEYTTLYISFVQAQIDAYVTENMYAESFELLDGASNVFENHSEIESMKTDLIRKYEKYVQSTVENYIAERNINEAIFFLNKAKEVLPYNSVINEWAISINDYLPIELIDIHVFSEEMSSYGEEVAVKDTYQTEYNSAIRFSLFSYTEGNYIEYLLNEDYEHFSTIITPYERWTSGKSVKIIIIGDDVKLYETLITREAHPITVDLDVTGVEILRIEFEKEYYYSNEYILFADACVYKEY